MLVGSWRVVNLQLGKLGANEGNDYNVQLIDAINAMTVVH